MTNEEKAREIGEFFETPYLAALEMAEWKDQRFKTHLEGKRDYYYHKAKGNDIETLNKIQCLNEIINELFGGE